MILTLLHFGDDGVGGLGRGPGPGLVHGDDPELVLVALDEPGDGEGSVCRRVAVGLRPVAAPLAFFDNVSCRWKKKKKKT